MSLWGMALTLPSFTSCDVTQSKTVGCLSGRGLCRYHVMLKIPQCLCLCHPIDGQYSGHRCETSIPFSGCGFASVIGKLMRGIEQMNNKFGHEMIENKMEGSGMK